MFSSPSSFVRLMFKIEFDGLKTVCTLPSWSLSISEQSSTRNRQSSSCSSWGLFKLTNFFSQNFKEFWKLYEWERSKMFFLVSNYIIFPLLYLAYLQGSLIPLSTPLNRFTRLFSWRFSSWITCKFLEFNSYMFLSKPAISEDICRR